MGRRRHGVSRGLGDWVSGEEVLLKVTRKALLKSKKPKRIVRYRVVGQRTEYTTAGARTWLELESVTRQPIRVRVLSSRVTRIGAAREECRTVRHKPGLPSTAVWEVEYPGRGTWLAVRTPWNAAFVEKLKRLIPAGDRFWTGRRRLWYVRPSHRILMEALVRLSFKPGSKACRPTTGHALQRHAKYSGYPTALATEEKGTP